MLLRILAKFGIKKIMWHNLPWDSNHARWIYSCQLKCVQLYGDFYQISIIDARERNMFQLIAQCIPFTTVRWPHFENTFVSLDFHAWFEQRYGREFRTMFSKDINWCNTDLHNLCPALNRCGAHACRTTSNQHMLHLFSRRGVCDHPFPHTAFRCQGYWEFEFLHSIVVYMK